MGQMLDSLRKHLESLSEEELNKEFEELSSLNQIGPDVEEYAKYIKQQYESRK